MNEIVFTESVFGNLKQMLFAETTVETCAILLMSRASSDAGTRFLVRELVMVPMEAYEIRTEYRAELRPEFLARIVQRARQGDMAVGFVHTHVGIDEAGLQFSKVDDMGEKHLLSFLKRRTGTDNHVAVVASNHGMVVRMLGTDTPVAVSQIGICVTKSGLSFPDVSLLERYDRQVRAFGTDGQRRLADLRVGVVGLGGTGSLVAQSLAYLGVKHFILVDYDKVSETNLNRLVGGIPDDVGRLKVEVAKEHISRIQPQAAVTAIVGDVTENYVSSQLRDADFIFGCTDSHGSRAVLNQIAYQFLIPVIDMGMSIIGETDGHVSKITGRVQMLSPGLGCLVCGNLLDYDQVRWDLMRQEEREGDPYFIGSGQISPSVISINSTIASLAVTMFLGAVSGIPSQSRLQIYDGVNGTVRAARLSPVAGCIVCSDYGVLAKGDSLALPGRVQIHEL